MRIGLKRRHELDFYYDILFFSLNSALKSRISGTIRMNYQRLGDIIDILTEKGFLNVNQSKDNKQYFQTTKKGREFIKRYNRLSDMISASNIDELADKIPQKQT